MELVVELKTEKGRTAVGFKGYKYRKDKEYPTIKRVSWRCSVRGCKGRVQTDLDLSNPKETIKHSHFSDPDKIVSDQAVQKMKIGQVKRQYL